MTYFGQIHMNNIHQLGDAYSTLNSLYAWLLLLTPLSIKTVSIEAKAP